MDFKFEDIAQPLTKEIVKKQLESGVCGFLLKNFRKTKLEKLLEENAQLTSESNSLYEDFSDVFNKLQESQNTQIEYRSDVGSVLISGFGNGIFEINRASNNNIGRTIDSKTGLKLTKIPLILEGEDKGFKIFAYDQLDLEDCDCIKINYRYKTNFNTKYFHNLKPTGIENSIHYSETNNPLEIVKYRSDGFFDSSKTSFYHKLGERFYIRNGDVFCNELSSSIFGEWIFPFQERDRLHIEADIFRVNSNRRDSDKVYSGVIKSNGPFPFLV